jgi:hypothetical protein
MNIPVAGYHWFIAQRCTKNTPITSPKIKAFVEDIFFFLY